MRFSGVRAFEAEESAGAEALRRSVLGGSEGHLGAQSDWRGADRQNYRMKGFCPEAC